MPTYIMKDPEGMEHEFICSIAAMEKKKVEGWTTVFSPAKNNLIWHTGDIGSREVSDKLQKIAPLKAVFGNIDNHKILRLDSISI